MQETIGVFINKLVNRKFFLGLIFTFLLLLSGLTISMAYSKVLLDYSSPYGNVVALTSADFNADGGGEVAFLTGSQMRLYAVNGEGNVFYMSSAFSGSQPVDVEKVDVDGDGTFDVVAASDQAIAAYNIKNGSTDALYTINRPGGRFTLTGFLRIGDPNGDFASGMVVSWYYVAARKSHIFVYRATNGIVSTGKNETTYMANNLLPPYTVSSQIYCSSCHSCSETTSPVGPHGSRLPFILKANYRFELKETSTSDNYDANDFALCYSCHKSGPYEDATGLQRTDSNFRFHGYHLRLLYNDPGGGLDGGILTPGAGKGNAICRECHYSPHGSENERMVNFAPNVLGPNGEIGGASWTKKTETTEGTCNLKCHGYVHNPKTY